MKFSLIVATVDRTEQLERLLVSLDRQDHRDFELIVVDQNPDARLVGILAPYRDRFPIIHIRTSARGAARARNLGLKEITGDIVAFPDDDCWYPDGLLGRISEFFHHQDNTYDGITVRSQDSNGVDSNNRWSNRPDDLSVSNIWVAAIEYTIFMRNHVLTKVSGFDEKLGVGGGTPWGAGEGTDFLMEVLSNGYRFFYDPTIVVHHPQAFTVYDDRAVRRAASYGRGVGYVLRKRNFPMRMILNFLVRPLAGAILALTVGKRDRMKYHLAVFSGRLAGLRMNGRVDTHHIG